MCKIYYFNSTDITSGYERVVNTYYMSANRKIASCFQSPTTRYIFCFYQNIFFNFVIIAIEPTLELPYKYLDTIDKGENGDGNEYIFFKGVYLINNAGFYLYYKSISSNPTIAIKEWDGEDEIDDYNFEEFTLNKFSFDANLLYNDLINIKTNQICFTTVSKDKGTLYIIIFNFYNKYTKMVIRYYSIKLYELYQKKILFDLRITEFGNFLSLTSSFCSNDKCNYNSDDYYSYLIIFSYPSFADIDFDLIQHLKHTNDNITNININLSSYIDNIKIDNNIFGYYFKEIKILSFSDNIKLASLIDNKEIKGNYSLHGNENISISISLEEQKVKNDYIIKMAIVVSEPEYQNLNDYITDIDISKGDKRENSYYKPKEYIGKTSYFKIIKNGFLSTDCKSEECSLCLKEDNEKCINCKNEFTLKEEEKICKTPVMSTIPSIMPSTLDTQSSSIGIRNITSSTIIYDTKTTVEITKCSIEQILANICSEKITDEQIGLVHEELKKILKNNYTNENIILSTNNAVFQLSTLKDQNELTLENIYISNIDIGECEKMIRRQENLNEEDDLIILKIDLKSEDYKVTYIQYEIYNPNKTKIYLNICQNTSIYINTPVNLTQEVESLYDSLNKSGYNLFNSNDSFYNDICSPYTSENGIDIPISARQNEIYNNIKYYTICQNNCSFLYYNSTIKKSKCDCKAQIDETVTNQELINFKNELLGSFYATLKNSNFLVLKCFKLTFSIKGQTYNIGSYIMSCIFLLLIIFIIIHYITAHKKLHNMIKDIIIQKKNLNKLEDSGPNKKENGKSKVFKIINTEIRNKKKSKTQKMQLRNNIFKSSIRKSKGKKLTVKIGPPPKQKKYDEFDKRSAFINNANKKNKIIDLITKDDERKFGNSVKCLKHINAKKDKGKKLNKKTKFFEMKIDDKKNSNQKSTIKNAFPYSTTGLIKIQKKKNLNKKIKYFSNVKKYNSQELNDLEYELAIDLDKRKYFQYYCSLLKKSHLILFTFFSSDDYNLITIKISLFLLTLSLYFTTGGFFFTDETMHNVYINNGAFKFIYQIPLILYSSIITSFINSILKYLSLSENAIIKLKKENNINSIIQKAKEKEKILKIKFIFFYICCFIFMSFFWYFISSFCAVYKNTQIILIEDTLISFILSMLYPLGVKLVPGCFRIYALRAPKKDKKCLYKFSRIIALI